MSAQRHLPAVLTTVSVLALAAASTSLRAETEDSPADEPYAPLILQTPSLASQGQFYPPTVLADVTEDMLIMQVRRRWLFV